MDGQDLLEQYYGENARKLHRMIDRILSRFGGLYQKDYDDFYSLGNEVFADILRYYDGRQDFNGFLYSCLTQKIKTEITRRNRKKRTCDREAVSFDAPLDESGSITIRDTLASGFDLEQEVVERNSPPGDARMEQYLDSLTAVQRQILRLRMAGVPVMDIRKRLELSGQEYESQSRMLKSFEKTKVLFMDRVSKTYNWEEERMSAKAKTTAEICKETSYSVFSCIKRMDSGAILTDHPLQRNSDQWNGEQKGNLVTTILNGFPIPPVVIAEQVRTGGVDNYLLDGLQRFTNCHQYRNNVFKVGKKAERPLIRYQVARLSERGEVVRDKDGRTVYEEREFDLRNRYFRDLPAELQERFDDYTIQVVQYLNCSDEDVEYHIRRYNAAKPMSPAQKGITHLGEQYARTVKLLINKHTFFREVGNYKLSEFRNGTVDRVVVESMMAVHFLPDWKKRQEDLCEYLKTHATASHFDQFEKLVDRLSQVVSGESATLFDSKDSFLWFGLYARFTKMDQPDERYAAFLSAFVRGLYRVKSGGVSFEDLKAKPTKDKSTVTQKLSLLETLLCGYLKEDKSSKSA